MSERVVTEEKEKTELATDLGFETISAKLDNAPTSDDSLHKKFWTQRTFGSFEKTSVPAAILTLLNTAVGTGMLALPQAIGNFGYVPGGLMLVLGAANLALGLYCFSFLMLKFPGSQIYSQLVDCLLGMRWASFTNTLFILHVWSSLVAYSLVGKLTSAQTFNQFGIAGSWLGQRRAYSELLAALNHAFGNSDSALQPEA